MARISADLSAKSVAASCLPLLAWLALAGLTPAGAAEPYRIDAILPLTGSGSFLGQGEQKALEILEKQVNAEGGINGRPVSFDVQDDQTSTQVTVQLASKILRARPAVMVGPVLVAGCNAVAPLVKSGPVMYCLSAGYHPPVGSFGFYSYISTEDLYRVLLHYFQAKGWNKIAMITSTDASGQDAQKGIRAAMSDPANAALSLVADVTFNPTDVTVSAPVEKVRSAEPDVVVAWSTGTAIGNVFRAISDAGIKRPVVTTTANMTYAQMDKYKDFLPATLLFPASEWPPHGAEISLPAEVVARQKTFFTAFKNAGVKPDGPATYVWDSAMIVIDSLRALGPDATAEAIRDHISNLKGYAGINGMFDFTKTPQGGLDESDTVITRWDAGAQSWAIISDPGGKPVAGK